MNWTKHLGEWYKIPEVRDLVSSPYMKKVLQYLQNEYDKKIIYPDKKDVFKAFKLCNPKKIKVVILGQDPYFDGNATGLAFANKDYILKTSPSLTKIIESVEREVYKEFNLDFDPTLEDWADQGVLLLNTALTVTRNKPTSHFKVWDRFTKQILKIISENNPGLIVMLWGNNAQKYETTDVYDLSKQCYVLKAIHPAASAHNKTDWKCDNFVKANDIIRENNGEEFCIKW